MAQNEEKVVLHHEDRRWKFLSIIFITLFILSSVASVIYITNLLGKRNNLISQNILLQQQINILKEAKQAKDIPQTQFQLLSQQLSQFNKTNNELRKELLKCKKLAKK